MSDLRKVLAGALSVTLPGGGVRYYQHGDTIDVDELDDVQVARFEELGVFGPLDGPEPEPEVATVDDMAQVDLADVADGQLADWVSANTVVFILEQAADNLDRIEAVREAEHSSAADLGSSPRKTLVEGLDHLLASAGG